ncbi:MAG: crossover junction endodeoxyribonuclease RuvC [Nitrospinaceae bacterium]|nr:crossover junction endodeoxyribonuclease RuvC [Nitrospinaceae bacterium]MDP6657910.1 crossover junction endodeoxyribonuclease RuvC [Nitrospinaceae bacterium]MDP6712740.1 crossover junction endodeoxyribonuclease RuvC [Nitrospinaceae bacterium]MDP7057171.1 crossover junction endodeoxyribonuclease RuvC [Nitrospinaceae bacterium]
MRVMGIDPGSNCTGYGIVEETNGDLKVVHWGSVKTRPRQSFPEKLKFIYDELIATSREFNPDEVAVEDMFYATNVKSALKLGQTRGVAILSAVNEGKPVAEYSPLEVKQSVVGYGRAEKEQVQDMVTAILKLKKKPEPLDASDALAVAICHIHAATANSRLKAAKGT